MIFVSDALLKEIKSLVLRHPDTLSVSGSAYCSLGTLKYLLILDFDVILAK